jgi:cell division protein ZapA (FtsZ GTPase activity inhibitor)
MARGDLKTKIQLVGDATGATKAIKTVQRSFNGLVSSAKTASAGVASAMLASARGVENFATSAKKNIVGIIASVVALRQAFIQVRTSADQIGQSDALERRLAADGISIDKFIGKLKELSDNQIATADLILAANRALALGIRAEDLGGLMEVAATASAQLGISMTQAFNDITTGIGRASPQILDNLAIVIDAIAAYDTYAKAIGSTAEALTKNQKTIALSIAVVDQAAGSSAKLEDIQSDLSRQINQSTAAFNNFTNQMGRVLGGLTQMFIGGTAVAVTFGSTIPEGILKLGRAFIWLARAIPFLDEPLEGTAKSLKKLDDEFDRFQQRTIKFATEISKGGIGLTLLGLGVKDLGEEMEGAGKKTDKARETLVWFHRDTKKAAEGAEELGEKVDDAGGEVNDFIKGLRDSLQPLDATRSVIARTANEYDRLARSMGLVTAAQAALAGGAQVTQGGTRLRFPGGGSRLIRGPGEDPLFPNLGGGVFSNTRVITTVGPGGRIMVP